MKTDEIKTEELKAKYIEFLKEVSEDDIFEIDEDSFEEYKDMFEYDTLTQEYKEWNDSEYGENCLDGANIGDNVFFDGEMFVHRNWIDETISRHEVDKEYTAYWMTVRFFL